MYRYSLILRMGWIRIEFGILMTPGPMPLLLPLFCVVGFFLSQYLLYLAIAFCRPERDWGSLQLLDLRWVMCQGRREREI